MFERFELARSFLQVNTCQNVNPRQEVKLCKDADISLPFRLGSWCSLRSLGESCRC
jgi:hypothetical protein